MMCGILLRAALAASYLMASTPLWAGEIIDSEENDFLLQRALVKMLSPLEVTESMVEKVGPCQYKVKRPQFDFYRVIDLRLLDNVLATGKYLSDEPQPDDAVVLVMTNKGLPTYTRQTFWCKYGGAESPGDNQPYGCELAVRIEGATINQFMKSYEGAARIVEICNPSATYKPCPSGIFEGFKCAL